MKTRNELYQDCTMLLEILSKYPTLLIEQVYPFFPKKQTKAVDGIIYNLVQQKRIVVKDGYISLSPYLTIEPNHGLIQTIWVLLDFYESVIYHAPGELPCNLVFLTHKDCYEVIYIKPGEERQICSIYRLLPDDDQVKRLIVVEQEAQIKQIQISQTLAYCTINPDGQVSYYFDEEE